MVYIVKKNATEEIRIDKSEFHGHNLLNIRIWYQPKDGEEMRPTKKGISVQETLLPELIDALVALQKGEEPPQAEKSKQEQKPAYDDLDLPF